MEQRLSASLEDYLEAILHIVTKKHVARAKDIVQRLGVNHSSVTVALRSLANKGLINYAPYEVVTLTAKGKRVSQDVARRHSALQEFFIKVLSVDSRLADETACEMEHTLPSDILDRLTDFVDFIERCPQCLEEFHQERKDE
jgi:DtxR family Mn-dependent transcriptional regulator